VPRLDDNAPMKIAKSLSVQALNDFTVTVVSLKEPRYILLGSNDVPDQVKVERLQIKSIVKIIRSSVVHTHGIQPDILLWLLKLIFRHIFWISTLHCNPLIEFADRKPSAFFRLITKIWVRSLGRANCVVFLNAFVKNCLRLRNRAEIVYNGLDVKVMKSRSSHDNIRVRLFANGRKVVGGYGVLRELKGFDQLISAAVHLPENICIVIAGDGNLKQQYQDQVEMQGLRNRVLFLGHCADAHKLLPEFDLFVMPSRSEGFPLALVEALSYEKNIVLSNIPQFKELSRDLDFGIYRLDDIDSLCKEIKTAIAHPKSSVKNNNYCQNTLTGVGMYARYKEIYNAGRPR